MIFLSGLGAIFVAIFDAILISLPIFILLLLIKTFNKAARIDQVEQEVKKLRKRFNLCMVSYLVPLKNNQYPIK